MKKDWEIKKLGELGNIFSGNSINEKEKKSYMDLSKKGLFYVATKDISTDSEIEYENGILIPDECLSKFKIAHKDSVLICAEGGSAGKKLAYNSKYDICFVNKLFAFESKNSIFPKFVFYYYQSSDFSKHFKNRLAGLIGGVSLQKFKEIPCPVPPLEEQKRIVKILDEKFAQLETIKANAQTNLQNAKDLFQSQLTKAFSNTTWEKKRLGDCGTFKNGMNFAATDSGYTIRSLGVGDFKDRYSIDDTETLSEISLKAAPSEDYLLHDGDIVFVRSNGNKELVGRCVLVYPKDIPTTYSGFCIRFRKDFDLLDADFLLHFMKSESSRKILNGKEGANISNLNQKILGDFEVPLPPLPEQKRIVKELDTLSEKVRQLQEIYTKQIANCDELKQSLLQKAFDGEL